MLAQAAAFSQSSSDTPLEALDEVVVVGRFPGPPLWKVSKGEHALWILPTVDLYPRKMEWASSRVQALIAASQEYIEAPFVSSGLHTSNPLHLARLMSMYRGMERLPGKQTLADVLPTELHHRFRAVKVRYFPDNTSIESMPVGAAPAAMRKEFYDHDNLTSSLIADATGKWLKSNKAIRRTVTGVSIRHKLTSKEVNALKAAIKEVAKTPEFEKVQEDCFENTLTFFEKDVGAIKRRANAWAKGSVDDLVNPAPLVSARYACVDPFSPAAKVPVMTKLVTENPGLAPPDLEELERKSRQQWLDAAEKALTENRSTFALLGASDVIAEDGLVARLKAKGYVVEISAQ
jgi:hypothetical protein